MEMKYVSIQQIIRFPKYKISDIGFLIKKLLKFKKMCKSTFEIHIKPSHISCKIGTTYITYVVTIVNAL